MRFDSKLIPYSMKYLDEIRHTYMIGLYNFRLMSIDDIPDPWMEPLWCNVRLLESALDEPTP